MCFELTISNLQLLCNIMHLLCFLSVKSLIVNLCCDIYTLYCTSFTLPLHWQCAAVVPALLCAKAWTVKLLAVDVPPHTHRENRTFVLLCCKIKTVTSTFDSLQQRAYCELLNVLKGDFCSAKPLRLNSPVDSMERAMLGLQFVSWNLKSAATEEVQYSRI